MDNIVGWLEDGGVLNSKMKGVRRFKEGIFYRDLLCRCLPVAQGIRPIGLLLFCGAH